jgi:putative membrane protein
MLAGISAGIHLIAVLGSIVGLLIILMASAATISVQDLKAINRVYVITGLALFVAAVAGCVLWLVVGKPAEFYSNNPVFHAKLGAFILLVLIIGYTGIRFRLLENTAEISSLSSSVHSNEAPIAVSTSIRRLQKTCIPLMIIVPALAWMMARGIGY